MLQDDSGELFQVKLDPSLVNSENAIIVLDEYNDICWVWIGRNVSMPTRMHALRMSKSVQKAGFKIGSTNIGMATSKLVELMEKNDSDLEVSAAITAFKEAINVKWSFDDEFLAYDPAKSKGYEAEALTIRDTAVWASSASTTEPPHIVATTVEESESPLITKSETTPVSKGISGGSQYDKKAAFLVYSVVKHADLVYTEKIQRDGKSGLKIEAPAIVMLEVLNDSDNIVISPANFGDSETAVKIRTEYESWLERI
ncbi:MAG: hypothetical protein ACTSU3_03140 [Candidatus Thorarchaeota archaeon]